MDRLFDGFCVVSSFCWSLLFFFSSLFFLSFNFFGLLLSVYKLLGYSVRFLALNRCTWECVLVGTFGSKIGIGLHGFAIAKVHFELIFRRYLELQISKIDTFDISWPFDFIDWWSYSIVSLVRWRFFVRDLSFLFIFNKI